MNNLEKAFLLFGAILLVIGVFQRLLPSQGIKALRYIIYRRIKDFSSE